MNPINAIKSGVGWVFGSDKTTDAVINGVDALIYTAEERAEYFKDLLPLMSEYQRATAPQNVARRKIGLMVMRFTLVYGFAFLVHIVAYPWIETGPQLEAMFTFGQWFVMPLALAVMGFYFMMGGVKTAHKTDKE